MKEELAKIRRCVDFLDTDEYLEASAALDRIEAAMSEPFGYFRAEPFSWTDCAEDDEGAKALYEMCPATQPELWNNREYWRGWNAGLRAKRKSTGDKSA